MRDKFIKSYYDFFDKQIGDSTIVIALIGVMIFLAGFLSQTNGDYLKGNVMEFNTKNYDSIVFIDGKKYKINLEEVK